MIISVLIMYNKLILMSWDVQDKVFSSVQLKMLTLWAEQHSVQSFKLQFLSMTPVQDLQ